jgi:CubicO group peptidase (beta-lactamase class C family)
LLNGGLKSNYPTALGGTCSASIDPLRELFPAKLESSEDLAAPLAFNIDGEMVVDRVGWADEARTVAWAENTITNVFSSTKSMNSLAAIVLVDRGELDLDTTVAQYWPEFAALGKEGIKFRLLLSQTSGVSGWDQPVTIDDLYDWDKSTAPLDALHGGTGPGVEDAAAVAALIVHNGVAVAAVDAEAVGAAAGAGQAAGVEHGQELGVTGALIQQVGEREVHGAAPRRE